MIKKKKITQSLLPLVFGTGIAVASVMAPEMRMEKVKELFGQYGTDTFKILNGQGLGGTGGDGHTGKGLATTQRADIAEVINSTDDNAFVFCIEQGNWVVYPPEPTKIGTSALTATDSRNMPFVDTMIAALRENRETGKASGIEYYVDTAGGPELRIATVWSSKALLGRPNDTGKKFFCGTSIKETTYSNAMPPFESKKPAQHHKEHPHAAKQSSKVSKPAAALAG